jgi:polyisoprenoid-binding protein YceI
LASCRGAQAVEYSDVNTTASTISFTYQQMGSRNYGTFNKFEARLNFDTDNPSAAHAALSIDLNGIFDGELTLKRDDFKMGDGEGRTAWCPTRSISAFGLSRRSGDGWEH